MRIEELHKVALRLHESGHHEEALKLLREILAETNSSEIWSDWATIQFRRGELGEAEAGYRLAMRLNPQDTQAPANLGALLFDQGRIGEALPYLEFGLRSAREEERVAAQQLRQYGNEQLKNKPYATEKALEAFLREYVSDNPVETSYFETHVRRFVATLQMLPAGTGKERILELGSGLRHLTPAVKHCKGYGEVRCAKVGAGKSRENCKLTSRSGKYRDTFIVNSVDAQGQEWPYADAEFDTVVCCEVLEHLWSDPMGMLAGINRILKNDGLLLLTTPNLASGHAVEETLRGGSPYTQGKFEIGGTASGRHSREYTAAEVERLAGYAGFEVTSLRTQDLYWQPKTETLQQLVVQGFSVAQRGDTIFVVAKKRGPVRERYPEEFYVAAGLRMCGEGEGASEKLSPEPAAVAQT